MGLEQKLIKRKLLSFPLTLSSRDISVSVINSGLVWDQIFTSESSSFEIATFFQKSLPTHSQEKEQDAQTLLLTKTRRRLQSLL